MEDTLLDVNVEDAVEPAAVQPGDYTLRIVSAEKVATRKDPNKFQVALAFRVMNAPEGENPAIVRDWLQLPNETDDAEIVNRKKLSFKRFYEAFDIDASGPVDIREWIDKEAEATLKLESSSEYGDQNRVARYKRA